MSNTCTAQIVFVQIANRIDTIEIVYSCDTLHHTSRVSGRPPQSTPYRDLVREIDHHIAVHHSEAVVPDIVSRPLAVVVNDDERSVDESVRYHVIPMTRPDHTRGHRFSSSDDVRITGNFKHQGRPCEWKIFDSIEGGQRQTYMIPLATVIDAAKYRDLSRVPTSHVKIYDGDVVILGDTAYVIRDDVAHGNPRLERA